MSPLKIRASNNLRILPGRYDFSRAIDENDRAEFSLATAAKKAMIAVLPFTKMRAILNRNTLLMGLPKT